MQERSATIPAPAIGDDAPPWAAALCHEVHELRCALVVTNELLISHSDEMASLRRDMRRVHLAQLAIEHRQSEAQKRLEPLEAVVLPLVEVRRG